MSEIWHCDECREAVPAEEAIRIPLKHYLTGKITATACACPYCDDVLLIERVSECSSPKLSIPHIGVSHE